MYHISANLAFGRREKNIWGYKKLQGGKKPIRKTEKKVATFFFFFFFGDSKKFVGAAKNKQGAPNGNVTPLSVITVMFCVSGFQCIFTSLTTSFNVPVT